MKDKKSAMFERIFKEVMEKLTDHLQKIEEKEDVINEDSPGITLEEFWEIRERDRSYYMSPEELHKAIHFDGN